VVEFVVGFIVLLEHFAVVISSSILLQKLLPDSLLLLLLELSSLKLGQLGLSVVIIETLVMLGISEVVSHFDLLYLVDHFLVLAEELLDHNLPQAFF